MTTQEINTALKGFAKQDTKLAMKSGSMMITDTLIGLITLNFENGLFQSFNRMGEELTGTINKTSMENWLVSKYSVEV